MHSPVQGHRLWALQLGAGCEHRRLRRQGQATTCRRDSHLVLLHALCLWQVCGSGRASVLLSIARMCHQLLGGSSDSGLDLIVLLVDRSNDLHQLPLRLQVKAQEGQQQGV